MMSIWIRSIVVVAILVLAGMPSASAQKGTFTANLSGGEEVPPVSTLAHGEAIFRLTFDDSGLQYRLIVANIEAVTQAHIHLGLPGQNGPVVAFLFGFEPGGVFVNGTLAQGIITAGDLTGPLAGMSLDDLLDAIRAGNTYVNVHTLANPPGEIRGQIR